MWLIDKRLRHHPDYPEAAKPDELETPAKGNRVYYDSGHPSAVSGFGVRVTKAGARSFILNYYIDGNERRYTIGRCSAMTVAAARAKADKAKASLKDGKDPLAEEQEKRDAPTVRDLCAHYEQQYLPRKRPSSQRDDLSMINRDILPKLGSRKVASIRYADIDRLHRKITLGSKKRRPAPYAANRTLSLLSRLFTLAIKWDMRSRVDGNPCEGIERNYEPPRERYLSKDELVRLLKALDEYRDQQAADIFRLLLLTGARSSEVRTMRWRYFDTAAKVWAGVDFENKAWIKPGSQTKTKRYHRVTLSGHALLLLARLRDAADPDAQFVFPSERNPGAPRENIKDAWADLRKAAKIEDVRPHDLRHSFASFAISGGATLPMIGKLLGHTQASTSLRYAHLHDEPQRATAETVGAIITGQPSAEIAPLKGGQHG